MVLPATVLYTASRMVAHSASRVAFTEDCCLARAARVPACRGGTTHDTQLCRTMGLSQRASQPDLSRLVHLPVK
jgi:hypothetical protein